MTEFRVSVVKASILYTHKNLLVLLIAGSLISVLVGIIPATWGVLIVAGAIAIFASLLEPIVALGLAIIIGPLRALVSVVWPDMSVYPGQILFALFVLSWFVHFVASKTTIIRFPVTAKILIIYLCVGLLSLWGATSIYHGMTELVKWLQILVVMVLVFNCCVNRDMEKWIIVFVVSSGCLQALIGLWQFIVRGTGPESFELTSGIFRAYGTFEQPNPFGGFMGMVWPLVAGILLNLLKNKMSKQTNSTYSILVVLTSAATILIICALIVSYSRGAWIGATIAFIVMLFFLPSRPIIGLIMVIAAVAFGGTVLNLGLVPERLESRINSIVEYVTIQDVRRASIDESNFSVVERAAHWQAASNMLEDHPWLGVGMGNYQVVYPQYRLVRWKSSLGHAHNVYLNVAAETGFLGLGVYVVFWGYVFLKTINVLRNATNWNRGIALGLLGVWTHLGVHNFVDNLFVNNIHLCLGGLLGVLSVVKARVGNNSSFA